MNATLLVFFIVGSMLITVVSQAGILWIIYRSEQRQEEMQRKHHDLISLQISQTKSEFMKMSHSAESLSNLITKLFDPINGGSNG